MRYIKTYKIFEDSLIDVSPDRPNEYVKSTFGISLAEISDLLVDIEDEFPDIDYWIDDAEPSWLVKPNNSNIFVIYFESNKPGWERENLYDLEHFLMRGKLKHIKSYIEEYGLDIYAADYGESDTQYEIVICKKGTQVIKGKAYEDRYPTK